MDILVIGGGGREHAICWSLSKSTRKPKLYCAPGNPGIAELAECVDIQAENIPALVQWVQDHKPNLVMIGPELPLALGLADELLKLGVMVVGPTRAGAQMEASKDFTKQLLFENNIPTAKAGTFTDYEKARAYLQIQGAPIVIKADGLAAGKGVTVCDTLEQAEAALRVAMLDRAFGEAGSKVVIEEFLRGEETSVLAFVDGETIVPMVSAQDHKRVFDGDKGPNTGGMGAYSPAPVVTDAMNAEIMEKILKPTLEALKKRGIIYRGILYAGLMITAQGPKVIEYNCRFGDPETQVILPRLKTDLVNILMAVAQGKLSHLKVEWDGRPAACIVLASAGYPGPYPKGKLVMGLKEAAQVNDAYVFHAGTTMVHGRLATSGGRVLCVTGVGDTIVEALQRAYRAVSLIHFEGMQFRKDIGWRAIQRK